MSKSKVIAIYTDIDEGLFVVYLDNNNGFYYWKDSCHYSTFGTNPTEVDLEEIIPLPGSELDHIVKTWNLKQRIQNKPKSSCTCSIRSLMINDCPSTKGMACPGPE